MKRNRIAIFTLLFFVLNINYPVSAGSTLTFFDKKAREEKKQKELESMQGEFKWWPSDAQPAPVKDDQGGYWWWPTQPGQATPWGNRGYVYLYKIIYDYAADEDKENKPKETTPPAKPELKPSLLIKKIIRNVKIYFDYNKADLREDAETILKAAVKTLQRNPDADILITGNCDARGSDEYNMKLGKKRGATVQQYMLDNGIPAERIKIVSRGKLDAVAPVSDLMGMQKDRNAQFMIAEVDEIMLPAGSEPTEANVEKVSEDKYMVQEQEKVESSPKVSSREYVIQKNDSLWKIAAHEMGDGHRWKYLYDLNKDRIKNPNKLKAGTTIIIPVE